MIKNIKQPDIIDISSNLRLRTTNQDDWFLALPWYQNRNVLYFSEGVTDSIYDISVINSMYSYLSEIGELYYIEILLEEWVAIGDVTLAESNFPIVIGNEEYWGKGIAKIVLTKLLDRARQIGLIKITVPEIYKYNDRSKSLFQSLGFVKVDENEVSEMYEIYL